MPMKWTTMNSSTVWTDYRRRSCRAVQPGWFGDRVRLRDEEMGRLPEEDMVDDRHPPRDPDEADVNHMRGYMAIGTENPPWSFFRWPLMRYRAWWERRRENERRPRRGSNERREEMVDLEQGHGSHGNRRFLIHGMEQVPQWVLRALGLAAPGVPRTRREWAAFFGFGGVVLACDGLVVLGFVQLWMRLIRAFISARFMA